MCLPTHVLFRAAVDIKLNKLNLTMHLSGGIDASTRAFACQTLPPPLPFRHVPCFPSPQQQMCHSVPRHRGKPEGWCAAVQGAWPQIEQLVGDSSTLFCKEHL